MSAPSPDISELESELESAAAPSGESEEPDADISEAVESATAEPEPVEDQSAPDAESDLAAVIAERDAYLQDLQRVTAEFANFRRQTIKRDTERVAHAASELAKKLLVVLDACEAAVSQGVDGIEAVQSQLLGVLSAEGLTVLGTVDEPFDPEFHEAVAREPAGEGSQDAPTVAGVLRTGYAWKGKMLRPAMVKVRG